MKGPLDMYRLFTFLIATTVFFIGTSARGDLVPWTYSWSANPGVSDGAGAGINFSTTSGSASGSWHLSGGIVMQPFTPDSSSHVLNNAPYNMTLHITDSASGVSGDFGFTGTLSGDISAGTVTNTFNAPVSQSQTLGKNVYAVTAGFYSPPGSPASGVLGGLGADVLVTGPQGTTPPPVTDAPEPSGLVLGSAALLLLGGWCWRQRRRHWNISPTAA
jgi:hypothetical protein